MKYIIMCGGKYPKFETPRHLFKINGEVIVERTIRLLKENGIKDIAISTDNPAFEYIGVPILKHENNYTARCYNDADGFWCDAFYPTNEPTCYLFGDVYFSDEAIKKIVETKTDDIELFGSTPPFSYYYCKNWVEPFALKVEDTDHLKRAIQKTRDLDKQGKFWRLPIVWELWNVIKDLPLQKDENDYTYNYTAINDYTVDIDYKNDVEKIERMIKIMKGELKMVKVEVIENFTLGEFSRVKNLVRKNGEVEGNLLNTGDVFECDEDMYKYLTETNALKKPFVKLIEVIPAKVEVKETPKEVKEIKTPLKKTTRKIKK